MSERIELSAFAARLNETFRVALPEDQSLELVLEEVKEHPSRHEKYECFALLFRGPQRVFLPQGTYELANEQLGSVSLFLVPVGAEEESYFYESLFNREKRAAT